MDKGTPSLLVTALVALVFGFAGAGLWNWSGMGNPAVEAYLLDNPEILPKMAEELQRRDAEKRLGAVDAEVKAPFPGAILGNPNGSVVLVEFTDYGCTYCRKSVEDVQALVAANPDLKVVIREWPIFQGSDGPARMALAAAKQGKFEAFHNAMFAAGSTSPEAVEAAAKAAGLDMVAANEFAASREAEFELMKNRSLAQQLGFDGTPAWVAGDRLIYGAVGRAELSEALASAKES
ncbi:MAG: DsbA family protein [Sphingomonadaceae bacterium]|nr:DsbA family protein [Sphingomonadaceae bacterium]